jgi:predicted PurR-regulated permease PerM
MGRVAADGVDVRVPRASSGRRGMSLLLEVSHALRRRLAQRRASNPISASSGHEKAATEGGHARSREQVIGHGITWLTTWTVRWIVLAIGTVLIARVVALAWPVLLPVVLAIILATVLRPPAAVLERRLHLPPTLAAAAVITVSLAIVGAIAAWVVPHVTSQVVDIAAGASDGLDRVESWLTNSRLGVTETQVATAIQSVQDRLRSSASSVAAGVLVGVSAVTSALINAVLALVLSFFFVRDGRHFLPWLQRVTGSHVGPHLAEVGSQLWQTLGGFIRTQALVGLIDAVLIGAGLLIEGVPLVASLTILTFIGAFVPIVGAVTVGALAVLVTLVSNGVTAAVIILVVILLVQQLEGNVLSPWLQGRSLRLHAAVILLSVTLGSSLFGVVGAFLAVPLAASIAVVCRYLDNVVASRAEKRST